MRYQGRIYRPPSEADALILQATLGCSWNHCTYCDMYREKTFQVRPLAEVLAEVREVAEEAGPLVTKVFLADGDALAMEVEHAEAILAACREAFPNLRRVSTYATAMNLLARPVEVLARLRAQGLRQVYVGPETGDDATFRAIAKGAGFAEHAEAARRARAAGIALSAIFLLGVAGQGRSLEHAEASARLVTAMDPAWLSLLTLTVVPGTPIARLEETGRFRQVDVAGTLRELRTIVALAEPTGALFRTNHASNHLPLAGRLPDDRARILEVVDAALAGRVSLRPAWTRGL